MLPFAGGGVRVAAGGPGIPLQQIAHHGVQQADFARRLNPDPLRDEGVRGPDVQNELGSLGYAPRNATTLR